VLDDADAGGEVDSAVREVGEDVFKVPSKRGRCRGGSSFEGLASLNLRFRGSTDLALSIASPVGGVAASAECARALESASFKMRALFEAAAFALTLLTPFCFPPWPLRFSESLSLRSGWRLESRLEAWPRTGSDLAVNGGLEMPTLSSRSDFMALFFRFGLPWSSSERWIVSASESSCPLTAFARASPLTALEERLRSILPPSGDGDFDFDTVTDERGSEGLRTG